MGRTELSAVVSQRCAQDAFVPYDVRYFATVNRITFRLTSPVACASYPPRTVA